MNAEFFDALDALEKTKGIPKEYMLERVEAALCSPLMPAIERKLITTFYLAKDVQWSCFGRLCRSAGTSRRRAADDLMAAEWLLGNLLRRLYDA